MRAIWRELLVAELAEAVESDGVGDGRGGHRSG